MKSMAGAALMVIDVQVKYMEPEPMVTSDGPDLLEKCGGLIDAARANAIPVIYIQHVDPDAPPDPELIAIHPQIAPNANEAIVQKTFGSAFMKTELESVLEQRGLSKLYLCGLATFGCVNHTVLCAVCRGYDVTVASDGHGTSPEAGPVDEQMAHFNRMWERAGATLRKAREIEQQFAA